MQFLYLGEVCVRESRSYATSTGHRASVETLAMCGSNYPFKYEFPYAYSHFISSAGGVPSAVSHLEGSSSFCMWPMQSHTTGSELHLSLPDTASAGAPRSVHCGACGSTRVAMVMIFQGSFI